MAKFSEEDQLEKKGDCIAVEADSCTDTAVDDCQDVGSTQARYLSQSLKPFSSTRCPPLGQKFTSVSKHSAMAAEQFIQVVEENIDEVVHMDSNRKIFLRVGKLKAVELYDGSFVRICEIVSRLTFGPGDDDPMQEFFIRGPIFKRNKMFGGYLPPRKNEVTRYASYREFPVASVMRQRLLLITNADFPVHRDTVVDYDEGRLICRWKFDVISRNKIMSKFIEASIQRISQHEADDAYTVDNAALRADWRRLDHGLVTKQDIEKRVKDIRAAYASERFEEVIVAVSSDDESDHDSDSEGYEINMSYPNDEELQEVQKQRRYTIREGPSNISPFKSKSRLLPQPTKKSMNDKRNTNRPPSSKDVFNDPELEIISASCPPSSHKRNRSLTLDYNSTPKKHRTLIPSSQHPWTDPGPKRTSKPFDFAFCSPLRQPNFAPIRKKAKIYTFGDCFCGGGGVSVGARNAGLKLKWAFDNDMDAAETYHTNFPDCSVWPTSVDIFLNAGQSEEEMRVDVMHLSPPCQPFSSAHTIDGKDDEDNEAAMLCIELCLRRSRPRFVTMEETDGVLNPKHQGNFISAVSSLIDCGYSVHWKVLNCKNFGVPCQRRRFFLIAASPGESLPPFPKPTYPDPGPYRTVRDAIGDGAIPLEASLQQQYEFETPRNPSCDWDQPCRNTILAGGGSYDVHPNGRRQFTLRELACLQSFPVDHEFNREGSQTTRTSIRRQIGNAVPPVMAKALFGAIRKHMEVVDRQRDRGT